MKEEKAILNGWAVSYIRYSTPEQARGDSFRRQSEKTTEYCLRKGLTLIGDGPYCDLGISGFLGQNKTEGKLGELLDDVHSGKIPTGTFLVVESLDRLGREQVLDQLAFFMQLLSAGLTVVTLGDGEREYSRGSNPMELMMALGVMSRANEESNTKSVRLSQSWGAKRSNIMTKPLTKMVPHWLHILEGNIVPRPERVKVVREIFRWASEGFGRRVIAMRLNARREPVWSSDNRNPLRIWRDSYVAKILANRAVIGEFQPHTKTMGIRSAIGQPIVGYYPAILSEEEFLAARHHVTSRGGRGGRATYKASNLFSGRLKCLHCGGPLHFADKGKSLRYLRCEKKAVGASVCACPVMKYDSIEQRILRELVQIDWPSLLEPEDSRNLKTLAYQDRRAILEGRIAELSRKVDNLLNAISDGDLSSKILVDKAKSLESEKQAAKNELEILNKTVDAANRSKRSAAETYKEVEKFLHLASNPECRLRLKRHIDDLLLKSYIGMDLDGSLSLILMFRGAGLAYVRQVNGEDSVTLRFEKELEFDESSPWVSLGELLETVMPAREAELLFAREPALKAHFG